MKTTAFKRTSVVTLFTGLMILTQTTLAQSNSGDLRLRDGVYNVDLSGDCAVKIINDLPNEGVIYQGVSIPGKACGTADPANEYSRVSASEFDSATKVARVITQEDVQGCMPTQEDPRPCYDLYYDSNGQPLAQAGDLVEYKNQIKILDSSAFTYSQLGMIVHQGKVINTEVAPDVDKLIFNLLEQ